MPAFVRGDSCILLLKLTPKAAKNALVRIEDTADGKRLLRATVTAVPEKGKANAALAKLLSQKLDLPKSCIHLIAGETSQLKTVKIVGQPEETLALLNAKLRSLGLMG